MVTLNGTFETSTGRKPLKLIEFDSSFKTAKKRSFFIKENRFIYGSFDPYLKPSLTMIKKALLAYDFGLKNQGRIIMWFNLDGQITTSSNRTIISFGNGTYDIFRVDVDDNYCYIYHNETLKCKTSINLSKDTWHFFSMDFTTSLIDVYIDGNKVSNSSLTGIYLSNLETYVGVSNVKQTRLNGYIELFGYIPTPYSGNEAVSNNSLMMSRGKPYYLYEGYDKNNLVISKNIQSPILVSSDDIEYIGGFTNLESESFNDNVYVRYSMDSNNRVRQYIGTIQDMVYSYDTLGRLIGETNNTLQSTTTYIYDNNGNILSKITEDNNEENLIFTYDTIFKDRLIKVENTLNNTIINIEYSSSNLLGYPSKIGGNILTWEEKQLKKYGNIEFFYNPDGTRSKKYDLTTGKTTEYIYDGNKIIRMIVSGSVYDFIYDIKGQVVALSYNNSEYFYQRDVLGNILGIIDNTGKFIVKYMYDGFGKVLRTISGSSTDSNKSSIIANNPFIYKGYCYDVETGLAMVGQRYYSPELCRFIQPADVSTLNPSSINGLNLYSYANNNPIGISYSSSGVGGAISGGMVGSVASSVGGLNFGYHGTISNSSNILGTLGTLSTAFGLFDQWSGYLSGGLDAGLDYWGPEGFGFQFLGKYSSALKKFGIGMTIAGNVLSWGSSVYNNFNNPNYSTGEAIGASFMDAAYYTGKGFGTYWLGSKVGELAVTAGIAVGSAALGATVFGTTIGFVGAFAIGGGVAVLVGIAGAVAIYYLGEWIDDGWEWLKKQIFE